MRKACLVIAMFAAVSLACNVQLGNKPTLNIPPGGSVSFVAPANNSTIAEGATIELAVNVQDDGAGVAKVEFYIDDTLFGTQHTADDKSLLYFTARQPWTASGQRGHLISATAYRADQSMIGRANVTVNVVVATYTALGNASLAATPTLLLPTLPVSPNAATPIPTTVTTSPTRSTVMTSNANGPVLTVNTNELNIRSGPGTTYTKIATLSNGDTALIIGRNTDSTWWAVEAGQVRGWVTANPSFSTVKGDTSTLPLMTSNTTPNAPTNQNSSGSSALAPVPTSTIASFADLVIDDVKLNPSTPIANQTFFVIITVRNQGVLDAPASLLSGLFQPGSERSDIAVPALAAGQSTTLAPMPVTLHTSSANQRGILTLDAKNEITEGANGEANNTRTLAYNVN